MHCVLAESFLEHTLAVLCILARKMDSGRNLHGKAGISRSKQKRQNRKAKVDRLQAQLKREKDVRLTASHATAHWKQKALLYKR